MDKEQSLNFRGGRSRNLSVQYSYREYLTPKRNREKCRGLSWIEVGAAKHRNSCVACGMWHANQWVSSKMQNH